MLAKVSSLYIGLLSSLLLAVHAQSVTEPSATTLGKTCKPKPTCPASCLTTVTVGNTIISDVPTSILIPTTLLETSTVLVTSEISALPVTVTSIQTITNIATVVGPTQTVVLTSDISVLPITITTTDTVTITATAAGPTQTVVVTAPPVTVTSTQTVTTTATTSGPTHTAQAPVFNLQYNFPNNPSHSNQGTYISALQGAQDNNYQSLENTATYDGTDNMLFYHDPIAAQIECLVTQGNLFTNSAINPSAQNVQASAFFENSAYYLQCDTPMDGKPLNCNGISFLYSGSLEAVSAGTADSSPDLVELIVNFVQLSN